MSFRVFAQEFAGGIEMRVLADAGENVEDLPGVRARVLDAIGRDDRQAKLLRQIAEPLIDPIFAAQEMALDFDDDVITTEDVDQRLRAIRGTLGSAGCQPAPSGSLPDGTIAIARNPQRCLRQAAANGRLAACAPQKSNQPSSILRHLV